jgi:hypothetical protein
MRLSPSDVGRWLHNARDSLTSIPVARSMENYILPDDGYVSVQMRDDFRLFGEVEF